MKLFLATAFISNDVSTLPPPVMKKMFLVAGTFQKLPADYCEYSDVSEKRQLRFTNFNILQSFAFIDSPDVQIRIKANKRFRDFMLDSGAFTYMNGKDGSKVDWDLYVEKYAQIINDCDIDKFIELDIDSVVGLREVERLRKKLERLTGKQPIPVWHKSRGNDYWTKMCHEYPYVAIGGIVTGEIKRNEYGAFRPMIEEAHRNSAKVHGLGFTNLKLLHQFNFDSVDSSSCNPTRFGNVSFFNGTTIINRKVPKGKRLDYVKATQQSFYAWVQFANYLELGDATITM